jgi:hypothetical protein
MTLRFSTALRNSILAQQPLADAMSNCFLKIYTGSQPASADAAPTGTLLCTYSKSSGAITRETLAVGTITLAGTSGSASTLTVNSIEVMGASVASDGTVAGTATLVATQINNNPANTYVIASTNGSTGVITLTAKQGFGALMNTWVLAGTGSTITLTQTTAMTGGVAAINGLLWGQPTGGVLPKDARQTWSGVAGATGTAAWFRFEASVTDAGALDSVAAVLRIDGAVATSGAELNLSNTAIQNTATQTLDTFSITEPTL